MKLNKAKITTENSSYEFEISEYKKRLKWQPYMRSSNMLTRSHKGLILDGPKEKVQGMEIRRMWRSSNGSSMSNPPSWICDIDLFTHLSWKICWDSIMREPHSLLHQVTSVFLQSHQLNTYFRDFQRLNVVCNPMVHCNFCSF